MLQRRFRDIATIGLFLFSIWTITLFNPSVFNSISAYIVFAPFLAIAKWRIGWIDKGIDWLRKKAFFGRVSIYETIGITLILGVWVYLLIQISMVWSSPNIFIARTTLGHWESVLALIVVLIYIGYKDIIKGFAYISFIYATHEIGWISAQQMSLINMVYLIPHDGHILVYSGPTMLGFFFPLLLSLVLLLVSYFIGWREIPRWKEVLIVFSLMIYYAIWVYFGFRISSLPDFFPLWAADPMVHLTEIVGWLVPCVVAMLPRRLK